MPWATLGSLFEVDILAEAAVERRLEVGERVLDGRDLLLEPYNSPSSFSFVSGELVRLVLGDLAALSNAKLPKWCMRGAAETGYQTGEARRSHGRTVKASAPGNRRAGRARETRRGEHSSPDRPSSSARMISFAASSSSRTRSSSPVYLQSCIRPFSRPNWLIRCWSSRRTVTSSSSNPACVTEAAMASVRSTCARQSRVRDARAWWSWWGGASHPPSGEAVRARVFFHHYSALVRRWVVVRA